MEKQATTDVSLNEARQNHIKLSHICKKKKKILFAYIEIYKWNFKMY